MARGRELAERLASELGNGFSIATDGTDQGDTVLISSEEPALNPHAEEAFTRRINEEAAEAARLSGEGLLKAYAPISKQVFTAKSRWTNEHRDVPR
ncbi:hypothetical protein ABIB35_003502 [Arthrobacter sp. UYP6]|uniref:hypothetical protein n=1 Tax=Arthrobacter sp. UYP6 TaxID=1756378 RepID=UPI003395F3D8